MTIEVAPASTNPKPAATSHANKSRSGANKQEAEGAMGFGAILAATGESDEPDGNSITARGESKSALGEDVTVAQDTSVGDVPIDPAALLAQALAATAKPTEEKSLRKSLASPYARGGSVGAEGLAENAAAAVSVVPRKGVKDAVDKSAKVDLSSGVPEKSAVTVANSKVADLKIPSAQEVFKALQSTVDTNPVLANGITREKAAVEQRGDPRGAAPVEPYMTGLQTSSGPMGAEGVVSSQPAFSVDAYVAERVSYWVGQDVQSAEMTLDGVGVNPVEVSITMQGNEAHVAFRTDELQARDALEHASSHLKDMLERQGVMLSGVSVGTSNTGDSAGQGRRQRSDARQGTVISAQPVTVDDRSTARVPNGRAVDLFV
jgi:flagellar hook-length control protein FliK